MEPKTSHVGESVLRGAGAGVLATAVMTGVMFGLQRAGALGRMPPRLLTERLLARVGLRRRTSTETREVLTAFAHAGFGATMGAIFEVARASVARRRGATEPTGATAAAGAAFGTLVWVTSYAGVIPALRLMPPPRADRPGRPTSMIVSHLVYGVALALALAACDRAITRPRRPRRASFDERPDRSALRSTGPGSLNT